MDIFKTKLITYTIAFGLLVSGCVGLGLYHFYPTLIDWNWYTTIVLFFLVIESAIMLYVNNASHDKDKKQMVNVYLLTKIAKMLASFVMVGVYYLTAAKDNLQGFVIVFILFYLSYLVAETYLFVSIEKHNKEKKSNDE